MLVPRSLVFFLPGVPDFEALFPVFSTLMSRHNLPAKVYTNGTVLRREPRLRTLLRPYHSNIRVYPNRFLKFFPSFWIRPGDVVVSLIDPRLDNGPHRRISKALIQQKNPTIFVQHGVSQNYLTAGQGPFSYISDCLLLYEPLRSPTLVQTKPSAQVHSVGFLKHPLFDESYPPRDFNRLLPYLRYPQRILLCQSFRGNPEENSKYIHDYYDLLEAFAQRNINMLLMVRSHRGISHNLYDQREESLAKKSSNVLLINRRHAPIGHHCLTDLLHFATHTVSTLSTAILDSVYMNRPTAVFGDCGPFFTNLPRIRQLADLEAFASAHSPEGLAETVEHYGDVRKNLDSASDQIAEFFFLQG